jgi:anti-sigma B factor antagonist
METNRPVVVKRIPERLNFKQARAFCREIEPILTSDRPQIVLDCSHVKQIDAAGVEMLLQCLAQVIKHDGDVKLAALSPQMAVILEMTRTDRLFEIYESSTDAVLSFSRFLPDALKNPAKFWIAAASRVVPPAAAASADEEAASADLAA